MDSSSSIVIKCFSYDYFLSPLAMGKLIKGVSSSNPHFDNHVSMFLLELDYVWQLHLDNSKFVFADAESTSRVLLEKVDGVLLLDTMFGKKVYGVKRGAGKRCAGCKIARYMSEDQQKEDWPTHRVFCKLVKSSKLGFQSYAKEVELIVPE